MSVALITGSSGHVGSNLIRKLSALDYKILVEKKLDQGLDEEQIYNYLKNKYGEWILYDPNFNKKTYFLWLLPILIFIMSGVVILKIFILKKN